MSAIPPGEMMFGAKLAPLKNVSLSARVASQTGPGGVTVRLKVWEYVLLPAVVDAMMTTGPAVAPAVTVMDAWPLELVFTLAALRTALPLLKLKVTGTPVTGLLW